MADPTPLQARLNDQRPELDPEIAAALAGLRRRIRGYIWLEGLFAAVVALGVAFWASLALDWLFEPPVPIRVALAAAAAGAIVILLFELIFRRAVVPLSDSSMALLLERRYPEFRDGLLTAVELTASQRADGGNAAMLRNTCREAARQIGAVRLATVFNPAPLRGAVLLGALAAGTVAAFVVLAPGAANIWARRSVMLEDILWPRRARMIVEGFPNGAVKVARGTDLEVVAKADMRMPLVPQVAEVRYGSGRGPSAKATMNRIGVAQPGRDAFQEFSYTFRGLLAPIRFDVHGGDDTVRNLRIDVVDSPAVVDMRIECEYPKYLGRAPAELAVTGAMQLPRGSRVRVRSLANKDLARVEVESGSEEQPVKGQALPIATASARSFDYLIDRLDKDTDLLFTLLDTDGIRSRDPVRLSLAAVADEPPRVAMQLRGIGSAIVPQARLAVAGQITDDYGAARAWFECAVDPAHPAERPIALTASDPMAVKLEAALDLSPLGLKPGTKLLACVKAADRCDLNKEPNVGTSERWLLDVVTPSQLRAMLEARELVLRQRFEAIIQEVTQTRDLLAHIDFESPTGLRLVPAAAPAPDPDDAPAGEEPSPQERIRARVERAQQNARKNAQETLGVAEAFDDIALQLINNQLDSEELVGRLRGGIAEPLRRVGDEMFPALDSRLEQLRGALGSTSAEQFRDAGRRQTEAILVAMQHVLSRMLELESFNEAVELLRAIIDQQEKVNDQTRQRHKGRLRDLLEE